MTYQATLVVPYFGTLPNYFPLFLRSVAENPDFELLLATDDEETLSNCDIPGNVRVLPMRFAAIRERVEDVISKDAKLDGAYKLCDYRPLYGLFFADELRGSLFWGHCDVDMLWGRIGAYISDEVLASNDKVLIHGHFSLYRNDPKINRLALEHPDDPCGLSMAASTPLCCYFDEVGFPAMARRHGLRVYERTCFADITPVHYAMRLAPICEKTNVSRQRFYWESGRIVRRAPEPGAEDEFMYIHLQKRPMFVGVSPSDDCWEIRSDGFFPPDASRQGRVEMALGELRQRGGFEISRIARLSPERVRLSIQVKTLRETL